MTSILGALCISATSFAGMSGTYRVIKSDCDDTSILSRVEPAVVQETDARLQVGVFHVYGPDDERRYFKAAFDFAVGAVREACLGDCYYLKTGAYSPDRNNFKETTRFFDTFPAEPVDMADVNFTLNGDELQILNGTKECLLKKVTDN